MLTTLIDDSDACAKRVNAAQWGELERILARAATPEAGDGSRAVALAAALHIPPAELKATAELAAHAGTLRAAADASAAELERLAGQTKTEHERLEHAKAAVGRLRVEMARIQLDVPGEVAQLRKLVEVAVAVAAGTDALARRELLRARGWHSTIHAGRLVYSRGVFSFVTPFAALEIEARASMASMSGEVYADAWAMESPAPASAPPSDEAGAPAAEESNTAEPAAVA